MYYKCARWWRGRPALELLHELIIRHEPITIIDLPPYRLDRPLSRIPDREKIKAHLELNPIVEHKDWWVCGVNLHRISRLEDCFTRIGGGNDRLPKWIQPIGRKLKKLRTG